MKVVLDNDDLKPLIKATVTATLAQLEADQAKLRGRLGYPEVEAAALLGIAPHVLRDCRLRGEVAAKRIGKKVVYSHDALLRFLGEASR